MWNVSSYRYDEFLADFEHIDRSRMPGIGYRIDRLRAFLPLIAYVILFIVGCVGNAYVAFVIGCIIGRSSTRAPRSVQIYILALCLADLIVLIFSLALIVDLFHGEWLVESKFLCLLYLSSESLNKFCSPFLLVALSYFCYTRICRRPNAPMSGCGGASGGSSNQFFDGDVRSATLTAAGCVVLSFAALTPVYMYGDLHFIVYENHSKLLDIVTKCAFEPSDPNVLTIFTIYGFTLGYAAPTLLFTCFHAAILWRVHRQQATRAAAASGGSSSSASSSTSKRAANRFLRVTRTIMSLVVFHIACWTPYWGLILYQVVTPMEEQGELSDIGVVATYFVHMLPYINCTGYPIVFTLMNRDIQEAYSRVVKARRGSGNKLICCWSGKSAGSGRKGLDRKHDEDEGIEEEAIMLT